MPHNHLHDSFAGQAIAKTDKRYLKRLRSNAKGVYWHRRSMWSYVDEGKTTFWQQLQARTIKSVPFEQIQAISIIKQHGHLGMLWLFQTHLPALIFTLFVAMVLFGLALFPMMLSALDALVFNVYYWLPALVLVVCLSDVWLNLFRLQQRRLSNQTQPQWQQRFSQILTQSKTRIPLLLGLILALSYGIMPSVDTWLTEHVTNDKPLASLAWVLGMLLLLCNHLLQRKLNKFATVDDGRLLYYVLRLHTKDRRVVDFTYVQQQDSLKVVEKWLQQHMNAE